MSQEKEMVLEQYNDATNLNMRLRIHQLYSTNKQDFHHWVFDQIAIKSGDNIIEFGCGPGTFWLKNADQLPQDIKVTLTDLSPGMIEEAKGNVDAFLQATYKVMDIQEPDFTSDSADVIICNHMLYHVPDIERALNECHRILKPSGTLYASTNGLSHMKELEKWFSEFDPTYSSDSNDFLKSFALDTGGEKLKKCFNRVSLIRFESNLEVTEIDHLLDYYRSMDLGIEINQDFRSFLETKRQDGVFHITKDGGLFIANNK